MADVRVSIRLERGGRRGWSKVSKQNGVSLSALLEALGRWIEDHPDDLPPEVLELAREIEHERKRRKPKP